MKDQLSPLLTGYFKGELSSVSCCFCPFSQMKKDIQVHAIVFYSIPSNFGYV